MSQDIASRTTSPILSPTRSERQRGSGRLAAALLAVLALPACAAGDGDSASSKHAALDGQDALTPTANAGGLSFAKYIALGDSFSSGFGEKPARSIVSYLFGTCTGVSKHPWSKMLWEQTLKKANAKVQYEEAFCAGHKIADMRNAIAKMTQAPANSLITFTIGGNDTGVSSELQTCLSSTDCKDVEARVLHKIQSQELRDGLGALIDALRAKAPGSTIVMAGYPHLLATNPSAACVKRGASAAKTKIVNQLIDKMNALISDVASKKSNDGPNKSVRVLSVTNELVTKFAGHEACTQSEWIGISTLMHPGANGHLAYAQAVAAALGGAVPTRIAAVDPDALADAGVGEADGSASGATPDAGGDDAGVESGSGETGQEGGDDPADGTDDEGVDDGGDDDGDDEGDDDGGDDGDDGGDDEGDDDGDDDSDDDTDDDDDGDDEGDDDGDDEGDDDGDDEGDDDSGDDGDDEGDDDGDDTGDDEWATTATTRKTGKRG